MQRLCFQALLLFAFLPSAFELCLGQTGCTAPYNSALTDYSKMARCSLNALNGNCYWVVDRLNASTPGSPIRMKKGATIKVVIGDLSPFETLSVDATYSSETVPVDPFTVAFQGLQASAGKITSSTSHFEFVREMVNLSTTSLFSNGSTNITDQQYLDRIDRREQDLANNLKRVDPYDVLVKMLTTLNSTAAAPIPGVCKQVQGVQMPWTDTTDWVKFSRKTIADAIAPVSGDKRKSLDGLIDDIQADIDKYPVADDQRSSAEDAAIKKLEDEHDAIESVLDAIDDSVTRVQYLDGVLQKLGPPKTPLAVGEIYDQHPGSHNDQTEVFNVDYVNNVAPFALKLDADDFKPDDRGKLSVATTPVQLTKIIAITALYQSESHFEFSTGLMVPGRPIHTYSAAAIGGTGSAANTIVDNKVQEILTYTVVPTANLHYRISPDYSLKGQRAAVFLTGSVGYNPSSSTLETGAGVTFSWKALMLSPMMDIGRDNRLADGFYIGQSLGPGNSPPKPTTVSFWSFKPAGMISIRIPLGTGK